MVRKESKRTIKEFHRYCDDCGKPAIHQCSKCYKDLCWASDGDCASKIDNEFFDTDNPDYSCKRCKNILDEMETEKEPHENSIYKIEQKYESIFENIRKEENR